MILCEALYQETRELIDTTMSINAGKVLDKIQYPFMINTVRTLEIEGNSLNLIKSLCRNPTANITLDGENQFFPPKVGDKSRLSILTTLTQHRTGSPNQHGKARQGNKKHTGWKNPSWN